MRNRLATICLAGIGFLAIAAVPASALEREAGLFHQRTAIASGTVKDRFEPIRINC